MPRENILTNLNSFVMHDGYKKLIAFWFLKFLNMVIKHCDWLFKFLNTVLECSNPVHIV